MVFVNNFYFNKVSEIYYVALDLELRRSPGERNGYPLQYSGLENSMSCIVHGVTKSQIWLSDFTVTFSFLYGSFLTSIHDYWKNYSFDYMDLCWQRDVSAL